MAWTGEWKAEFDCSYRKVNLPRAWCPTESLRKESSLSSVSVTEVGQQMFESTAIQYGFPEIFRQQVQVRCHTLNQVEYRISKMNWWSSERLYIWRRLSTTLTALHDPNKLTDSRYFWFSLVDEKTRMIASNHHIDSLVVEHEIQLDQSSRRIEKKIVKHFCWLDKTNLRLE